MWKGLAGQRSSVRRGTRSWVNCRPGFCHPDQVLDSERVRIDLLWSYCRRHSGFSAQLLPAPCIGYRFVASCSHIGRVWPTGFRFSCGDLLRPASSSMTNSKRLLCLDVRTCVHWLAMNCPWYGHAALWRHVCMSLLAPCPVRSRCLDRFIGPGRSSFFKDRRRSTLRIVVYRLRFRVPASASTALMLLLASLRTIGETTERLAPSIKCRSCLDGWLNQPFHPSDAIIPTLRHLPPNHELVQLSSTL